MKKWFAVGSVLLVLVLLVGCARPSTPGDQSGGESTPQGAVSDTGSTTEQKPTIIPVLELLTEKQAKAIALKTAKVTEDKISRFEIDLDYEEDFKRWDYEIDFKVGKTEYDIEINAKDGSVIRFNMDGSTVITSTKATVAAPTTTPTTTAKPKLISADKAKSIALKKADVTKDEISHYRCELEYNDDHKRWEYEIDFYVDSTEYDVEVCAEDGDVLKFKKETEDDKHQATATSKPTFLDEQLVRDYAILCAGVSENRITEYELELDYNEDARRWEYEVTFRVGRLKYEILIDAVTGHSLSFQKEIDD